jgi:hypothetical protein
MHRVFTMGDRRLTFKIQDIRKSGIASSSVLAVISGRGIWESRDLIADACTRNGVSFFSNGKEGSLELMLTVGRHDFSRYPGNSRNRTALEKENQQRIDMAKGRISTALSEALREARVLTESRRD